jgi:hypothetical protein
MSARPDDLIMGGIALLLVPMIGWRIVRGLRDGRLPLYRTYVDREAGSRFHVLLALHVVSLLLVGTIAADLLLGLGLRERL